LRLKMKTQDFSCFSHWQSLFWQDALLGFQENIRPGLPTPLAPQQPAVTDSVPCGPQFRSVGPRFRHVVHDSVTHPKWAPLPNGTPDRFKRSHRITSSGIRRMRYSQTLRVGWRRSLPLT
jgi:hypothetical protein